MGGGGSKRQGQGEAEGWTIGEGNPREKVDRWWVSGQKGLYGG